jgi:hypothetical protein
MIAALAALMLTIPANLPHYHQCKPPMPKYQRRLDTRVVDCKTARYVAKYGVWSSVEPIPFKVSGKTWYCSPLTNKIIGCYPGKYILVRVWYRFNVA